jgi:hypothetical protein
MGTTNKPLRIAVTDADLFDHPDLVQLDAMGHVIELVDQYDLVLGRRAWFMDLKHLRYLAQALVAARKRLPPRVVTP